MFNTGNYQCSVKKSIEILLLTFRVLYNEKRMKKKKSLFPIIFRRATGVDRLAVLLYTLILVVTW